MKTRRKNQRKSRKQIRQKGGATIFTTVRSLNSRSTPEAPIYREKGISLSINEKTPREVFEDFLLYNDALQASNSPLYYDNGDPRFKIYRESVPIVSKTNDWNNRAKLTSGTKYRFVYISETEDEKQRKIAEWAKVIKIVLKHYSSTGAKIILSSSATTSHIPKNVNQQFKFHANPKTPILLIDPAFFRPGHYEFFQYLKFEGPVSIPGTNHKARMYKKPAGKPFEIVGEGDHTFPIETQEAYLAEVKRQCIDKNGTRLFNELDELEICCVQVGKEDGFSELIAAYRGLFPVYSFDA